MHGRDLSIRKLGPVDKVPWSPSLKDLELTQKKQGCNCWSDWLIVVMMKSKIYLMVGEGIGLPSLEAGLATLGTANTALSSLRGRA